MDIAPVERMELLELLKKQQKVLELLAERLEPAAPAAPERPAAPAPGPIDWQAVTGEERRRLLRGLADFVDGLVHHYRLQLAILPCWWRHADAIEELSALWQVRQETFKAGVRPGAAMSWQDTLYKARDRTANILSSCREGHVEAVLPLWMNDGIKAELDAFIAGQR
ncbi:hypothetical protein [Spirillospora sp. NPDC029432]|uniref:hypothetical protein n=1 Tax=Spirillospora sp. NPDC029432 TaxID=3154599 RepID=UPI0034537BE1